MQCTRCNTGIVHPASLLATARRHHYLFAASHDEPRHLSVLDRYRVEQTIAGFWEYIELWFNDADAPNMTQVQN